MLCGWVAWAGACGDGGTRSQPLGTAAARDVVAGCDHVEPVAVLFESRAMFPICAGAFVEIDPTTSSAADALRRDYAWARQELDVLFPAQPRPTVLLCASAACKEDFGADPEAAAADDLGFVAHVRRGDTIEGAVVVSGPGERTAAILVHEWIHGAMGQHAQYELLPTWFNEGVATFFADEPRCPRVAARAVASLRSIDTKAQWQAHLRATGRTQQTYCQSRDEIAAWLANVPSRADAAAAARAVADAVANGSSFDAAYGRLHTE